MRNGATGRGTRRAHLDWAEEVHGEVHRAGGHHECTLRGRKLVIDIRRCAHDSALAWEDTHREALLHRLLEARVRNGGGS